jgi:hypothetical protein
MLLDDEELFPDQSRRVLDLLESLRRFSAESDRRKG